MSTERGRTSGIVRVEGLNLHYVAEGEGPPVLLVHGWPTSSFLWRHVMGPIARTHRVIALDLPGFGRSDKPTDFRYTFGFYDRIFDGFLAALAIDRVGLVVHDLGGPVALHWAASRLERVRELALLNTLVYPNLSPAAVGFVLSMWTPVLSAYLTSPKGLELALRIGLGRMSRATPEGIAGTQEPFVTRESRTALRRSVQSLSPLGMFEISRKLLAYRGPVRLIYGARDRILPDVAKTMARLQRDFPEAECTRIEDCGHFLQEERGDEVGELLASFFNAKRA